MKPGIAEFLRFYFITDDKVRGGSLLAQVEAAVEAGATLVQYRKKQFSLSDIPEMEAIRDVCRRHLLPFVVNDDVLLAKAVAADGVHLGQADAAPRQARQVLGPAAIIGASVSTLEELAATDLLSCDYIGTGPVYATETKADAKTAIGLSGLQALVDKSPVPVVAIGGVNARNIGDCMRHGASGGAVISCITRASEPGRAAREFARACGLNFRPLVPAWQDEFRLIDTLLADFKADENQIRVPPGDDAALFNPIANPVVTTDTQRQDIHFRLNWQTMAELGQKAVEITFSDLAASYARPQAFFVNLGVPDYMAERSIQEIYQGIHRALKQHKAVLGGGNISGAAELTMDLFAIGEGRAGIFPRRSNARPGDGVYVTGPLGLARAGRLCLEYGDMQFPELVHRFKLPAARFDAARILADQGVSCAMDISDGLAGDAAHIARASNLTISFEPERFLIDPQLAKFCDRSGFAVKEAMFAGGEDYELLFTCPHEVFREIRHHLPQAFRVGRCLPHQTAYLENLPPDVLSYQHAAR